MNFADKLIYIEVGSNTGSDTEKFVKENSILFCFEPVHNLYINLWNKYKQYDNVFIFPFAIDEKNDFQQFNVSTVANQGCSSLNEYNPNIKNLWPGRPDFTFGDHYIVPTITLNSFIQLYGIPHIDYLWIDAQGHDFKVLKSLESRINIVKEGRCEAAHNVNLYDKTDNFYKNILQYLEKFNFKCEIELDKSGFGAECDVFFKK